MDVEVELQLVTQKRATDFQLDILKHIIDKSRRRILNKWQ